MQSSPRLWKLPTLPLLAFAFSAGVSLAQLPSLPVPGEPQQPTMSSESRAWQAFLAENGPQWSARWNHATGTPKSIIGSGIDLGAGPILDEAMVRQQGQLALYRYSELLGINPTHFVPRTVHKTLKVWILVYDMVYEGVPVIGCRADLRICDNGVLAKMGAVAPPIPAGFSTTPSISFDAARHIAHATQGAPLPMDLRGLDGEAQASKTEANVEAGRLVIWTDVESKAQTPVLLAWEVRVVDEFRSRNGRVYIDAQSGQVLDYVNDVHHADVSGNVKAWVNPTDRTIGNLTNENMGGIRVTSPTLGTTFADANGDFVFPNAPAGNHTLNVTFEGTHFPSLTVVQGTKATVSTVATAGTPVQIQMLTSAATEFDRAQSQVFYHVYRAHEFVKSMLGGNLPAAADQVTCRVNIASTCNAYYTSPANQINFYASGGGCNNTGSGSVAAHEWGHGLDQWFGGISQTEGLSEAWGDTVSTYLFNQPIVGRDFTTSGGFVRTALNTRQYTGLSACGTSVHCQGEVFMGFTWNLRSRLMTSLGAGPGALRAGQIVLGSMPADATNQPDAVEDIFIVDDNDGNLASGTPNYSDLAAAAQARSYPYPQVQLVSFSHVALGSTSEKFSPRRADITVQPLQGTVSGVQMFSTVNGANLRVVPMIANGLPNGSVGLLPGVDNGDTVAYFFMIAHSGGNIRQPDSGNYSYQVRNDAIAFEENFDGATDNGWTHALVATQDDWQRGVPTGKFGTSSGVSWTDPGVAHSAPNCWGNDLGIGNFNGAYQNNVQNYLRSPVINLTGRTGIRVGFWRWLTVEDGLYDQATLEMNGTTVWANPVGSGSSHIIDNAWNYVEYAVPAADNNPAAQFTFRLVTDGGLTLGGWAIDDFRVSYNGNAVSRPVEYQASPEQVALGAATTLRFEGTPNAGLLMFFSATAGPLALPGLPTLNVDANFILASAVLSGSGALTFPIAVPLDNSMAGRFIYSQALEITPALVIGESNPMSYLFY